MRKIFFLIACFLSLGVFGQNKMVWNSGPVITYPGGVTTLVYYEAGEFSITFTSTTAADALVAGDATDVAEWNSLFNLPTNGTTFTSVSLNGAKYTFQGGGSMTLDNWILRENTAVTSIVDTRGVITTINGFALYGLTSMTTLSLSGCTSIATYGVWACTGLTTLSIPALISTGTNAFKGCTALTTFSAPSLTTAGDAMLYDDDGLTTIYLPICTTLGSTTGDDYVFFNIGDNMVTLTVPTALMTNNGGNPDGDIQYLSTWNTETIINP